MNNYYFTFGFDHAHSVSGFTYDKNVVVRIKADTPGEARQKMFDAFGDKWSFQYDNEPPEMSYFPRGIKDL